MVEDHENELPIEEKLKQDIHDIKKDIESLRQEAKSSTTLTMSSIATAFIVFGIGIVFQQGLSSPCLYGGFFIFLGVFILAVYWIQGRKKR